MNTPECPCFSGIGRDVTATATAIGARNNTKWVSSDGQTATTILHISFPMRNGFVEVAVAPCE